MKRSLRKLIRGCIALVMVSGSVNADDACQQLTIAAPPEYPPFSYTNEAGLQGAGVDIAISLAEALNLPSIIVSNAATWARVYQTHLQGDIDIVAALYRTPEREKQLYFIGSYASERTVLVASKKRPVAYSNWEDLVPLTGVMVNGDSRGADLDAFVRERLNMVKVHSFVNVENLLKAGRVDFAFVGEFSPRVTAFDYRSPASELYAADEPVTEQSVYISLSRKSHCAGRAAELKSKFSELITDDVATAFLMTHVGRARGRAIRQN